MKPIARERIEKAEGDFNTASRDRHFLDLALMKCGYFFKERIISIPILKQAVPIPLPPLPGRCRE
jgi:hypothetical protein